MTYSTPQTLLKFVLVEGKKAGFKDPWAGVNKTSSPLIFSIRGCLGQEWRPDRHECNYEHS